ncbi:MULTISPECIES: diguanylate cyclase domain-containing protein [Clostridium]|uniref:diguanylate cyclase domain-containing protein n=1 Tax=Clostridium TaxID=1485 RepID=UPI0034D34AAC|nr:diguanylate cyclase [Clostridium butyricum]MCQ2019243.1 diguanylate cyclase [Clostridium butyricum]MCQ2022871.1 diguanylate cyclase [Clostridium butyricum]MCQ2027033.1 diguanylate cyclase [Clostridium butyricum]
MYAFSCNKSVFFTQVEKYLKQNKNSKCALIFLDLDNFKFINDNFGHLTGDNVIKES